MTHRHWLGDLALAALLAIPTAALAHTEHALQGSSIAAASANQATLAGADSIPSDNRLSLFARG